MQYNLFLLHMNIKQTWEWNDYFLAHEDQGRVKLFHDMPACVGEPDSRFWWLMAKRADTVSDLVHVAISLDPAVWHFSSANLPPLVWTSETAPPSEYTRHLSPKSPAPSRRAHCHPQKPYSVLSWSWMLFQDLPLTCLLKLWVANLGIRRSSLCEVKSHLDYVHGWQNNFVENNSRNIPAKISFNGTSVLGEDCI